MGARETEQLKRQIGLAISDENSSRLALSPDHFPDVSNSLSPPAMDAEEGAGWELRVPQWRGLGLADPIKAVEVGYVYTHRCFHSNQFAG